MAERAHPDLDGFRDRWRLRWRFGVVPWPIREQNPYRDEVLWRYRWVTSYCQDRDVLDIPCGMGWGTSLIEGTRSLTGVDISEEAIREAKTRYHGHAEFRQGSMEHLAFDDGTFDTVVCLEGIEHVPQDIGKIFIGEAQRVLRREGQLLLSSPHPKSGVHSGNPYHAYEYTQQEMTDLLETCFTIDEVKSREVDELVIHYFRAHRSDG